MSRKKICILGLELSPVFSVKNNSSSRIAGSQTQLINIGNLLKNKFDIDYLVENTYSSPLSFKYNNFNIIPTYNPFFGYKKIRILYQIFKVWKGLKKSNADIYYQRVPSIFTGIIAFYCKIYNKKFIYSVANDNQFMKKWKLFNYEISF